MREARKKSAESVLVLELAFAALPKHVKYMLGKEGTHLLESAMDAIGALNDERQKQQDISNKVLELVRPLANSAGIFESPEIVKILEAMGYNVEGVKNGNI